MSDFPGLELWIWLSVIGYGSLWTLTYILIIRRGFIDRTYAMPIAALWGNLAWETVFSFVYPHHIPQIYVNFSWFAFDLILVYQCLKYGPSIHRQYFGKSFHWFFLLGLVAAFTAILAITNEFDDWNGLYTGFGQAWLISVFFIHLLLSRRNIDGQSLYIGLSRLFGTLIASIAWNYAYKNSPVLLFLSSTILIFDVIYLVMLYKRIRLAGINPWSRW